MQPDAEVEVQEYFEAAARTESQCVGDRTGRRGPRRARSDGTLDRIARRMQLVVRVVSGWVEVADAVTRTR